MQNVKNGHYDLDQVRNNQPNKHEPPTGGDFNFEELSTKNCFYRNTNYQLPKLPKFQTGYIMAYKLKLVSALVPNFPATTFCS